MKVRFRNIDIGLVDGWLWNIDIGFVKGGQLGLNSTMTIRR